MGCQALERKAKHETQTDRLSKADPTGWAARALRILHCPALVSALVLVALALIGLSSVGWAAVGKAETAAKAAQGEADKASSRLSVIEAMLQQIDKRTERIENRLIRVP